jgi:hypothetical protein
MANTRFPSIVGEPFGFDRRGPDLVAVFGIQGDQ